MKSHQQYSIRQLGLLLGVERTTLGRRFREAGIDTTTERHTIREAHEALTAKWEEDAIRRRRLYTEANRAEIKLAERMSKFGLKDEALKMYAQIAVDVVVRQTAEGCEFLNAGQKRKLLIVMSQIKPTGFPEHE